MSTQFCHVIPSNLCKVHQARFILHATTLGSEATGADEGECFTREAVTEMIVTSLKWKHALGFQKDGLSTSALR